MMPNIVASRDHNISMPYLEGLLQKGIVRKYMVSA